MTQLGGRRCAGWSAALVLSAQLCRVGAIAQNASPATSELSAEDQTWLHQTLDSSNSADLRWPHFIDYSQHLKRFYGFNGYSLWWVKDGQPTAQAMQVISALRQAGLKGLMLWKEAMQITDMQYQTAAHHLSPGDIILCHFRGPAQLHGESMVHMMIQLYRRIQAQGFTVADITKYV